MKRTLNLSVLYFDKNSKKTLQYLMNSQIYYYFLID